MATPHEDPAQKIAIQLMQSLTPVVAPTQTIQPSLDSPVQSLAVTNQNIPPVQHRTRFNLHIPVYPGGFRDFHMVFEDKNIAMIFTLPLQSAANTGILQVLHAAAYGGSACQTTIDTREISRPGEPDGVCLVYTPGTLVADKLLGCKPHSRLTIPVAGLENDIVMGARKLIVAASVWNKMRML